MVYSKELERDVTTTAMAKALLRLKTLALFLHRTWSVRFFYVRSTNKSCYVYAMCKMCLFWAKTGKTFAYLLRFDIKLKKSRSGFDLVTVLISKQSFFQHHVWPVYQGKSYLHGIALPDFNMVSPFFYKRSKQARVPTFVWLFRDVATTAKGPGCDEGTNLRLRDFAIVPLMPTREYRGFGFVLYLNHCSVTNKASILIAYIWNYEMHANLV